MNQEQNNINNNNYNFNNQNFQNNNNQHFNTNYNTNQYFNNQNNMQLNNNQQNINSQVQNTYVNNMDYQQDQDLFNKKNENKKSKFPLIIGGGIAAIGLVVASIFLFSNKSSNSNHMNFELDPLLMANNGYISNKIENYDVDLKEFKFEADNMDLYNNEINGKILNIIEPGDIYVNNKSYDIAFLTEDGSIYLYDKYDEIIKIEGKIKIKNLTSIVTQYVESDDLYICGDGYIYKLSSNGILTEIDNTANFVHLIDIDEESILGITNDGKLSFFTLCSKDDKNNKSGKCSDKNGKILLKSQKKFKYGDQSIIVDEDGNLYLTILSISNIYYDFEKLILNTNNLKIKYNDTSYSKDFLAQFKDNKTIIFDYSKEEIIDYNKKIIYNYGRKLDYYLLKTDDNIELLHKNWNNGGVWEIDTKQISNFNEYKDKIKYFGNDYTHHFILLTNGKVYELNLEF